MFLCVGGVGNQKWQECEVPGERQFHDAFTENGKDEVVVGPYDKEELKLFDVILFRQTDRYVLHRIIQKRGSRYLMQGDGVCRFYEECEDTDIIGVVRRVCRPSGKKIETDSACWRLESRLWLGLGGCRGMVLRVLNRLGCWLLF